MYKIIIFNVCVHTFGPPCTHQVHELNNYGSVDNEQLHEYDCEGLQMLKSKSGRDASEFGDVFGNQHLYVNNGECKLEVYNFYAPLSCVCVDVSFSPE
jgi:hypothetical protein